MDRALNYLALGRKAGLIELGEEPAGTNQLCLKVPYTKDELGMAIGRTSLAIAAFTDPAMALAFVKALPQPEKYSEELASLEERTRRVQQRQKEAKAHQRNKQTGRKPAGKH